MNSRTSLLLGKATVSLKAKRWTEIHPEFWECPQMTFGMPLRNKSQGQIPANEAARISADVATKASRNNEGNPHHSARDLLHHAK
ncbi:hypothetical protein [Sorangium sp. So ce124]|uniref:hypothetical protein n=1 Tax=Sorangium sp. So ce124 TaxID=3133280 RepID=UPI003F63ADA5